MADFLKKFRGGITVKEKNPLLTQPQNTYAQLQQQQQAAQQQAWYQQQQNLAQQQLQNQYANTYPSSLHPQWRGSSNFSPSGSIGSSGASIVFPMSFNEPKEIKPKTKGESEKEALTRILNEKLNNRKK